MERSDVVERAPTAVEEEATMRPEEDEPMPMEWTKVPKALEKEATARPDEAKTVVEGNDVVERATTVVEEEATARLEEDEPSRVEWIKAPEALEEEAMERPEKAEPAVEGSDVVE